MPFRNNMYDEMTPGMQMPYITCGGMPMYQMQMQQPLPTLPSGVPTGPTPTPLTPSAAAAGAPGAAGPMIPGMQVTAPPGEQSPLTVQNTMFTPGFLATQIGRTMRVEFLIGSTGPLVDRIGTLVAVGASYILLRPIASRDTLLCDIYSIKFVTIYAPGSDINY